MQKCWHFVRTLEIIVTDAHVYQKLFWVGTDRDTIGIYRVRIFCAICTRGWASSFGNDPWV